MIKLFKPRHLNLFVLGLVFSLATTGSYAADMSKWSDKTVCRLLTSQANNTEYLAEAQRRELDCGIAQQSKSSNSSRQSAAKLTNKQGFTIYPVTFSAADQQRLTSDPIIKTSFDFSSYTLAVLPKTIDCQLRLRRVVYERSKEGDVEHWNMASGGMQISTAGVEIDGKWFMRGLSKDSSYLRDEVNLRFNSEGHLVGKMAYFNLTVDAGEVPRKPLYIEVKPNSKSKPLNLSNPRKADIWIDVENWAGGILYLRNCQVLNN
ncbi:MAG TPA: hypothetical protein DE179_12560 [Oceanospirillaceae bacterium]|nr:hypothetical protein [Oceanospirillaceae bacterium]